MGASFQNAWHRSRREMNSARKIIRTLSTQLSPGTLLDSIILSNQGLIFILATGIFV